MKKALIILIIFISGALAQGQSVIFLHHSTGEGVYLEGNVASWIANYNSLNGKSYSITERAYPNTPYPWDNYPYDYWNLWVNGQCSGTNLNTQCLNNIVQNYDVVVFKHCFPGASVVADNGSPSVSSPIQTLANYKLQYRALRALMDQFPQKKFIVWTLAPLHRLATNTNDASRAREFVNWVKTTWLTEDGNSHPNIYIFDFFGLAAELSTSPANGAVNTLKYNYEKSHSDSDSHPNLLANQTIGPVFAQFVVSTIENQHTGIPRMSEDNLTIKIYPNPANNNVVIDFSEIDEHVMSIDIISLQGQRFLNRKIDGENITEINTENLPAGIYMVKVNTLTSYIIRRLSVLNPQI
jgi:hypothetical protein